MVPISPGKISLAQNYPNPFNPSTTIRYALPQRSNVTLSVYNTLGQWVATLVDGSEEAGYHDVKFDGSSLASGVYFYQLRAGKYVATKRLHLII
jgi:flagellar hook assembly protein FlgD